MTLRRVFPQSPVQGIAATPIPGILEAAVDGFGISLCAPSWPSTLKLITGL